MSDDIEKKHDEVLDGASAEKPMPETEKSSLETLSDFYAQESAKDDAWRAEMRRKCAEGGFDFYPVGMGAIGIKGGITKDYDEIFVVFHVRTRQEYVNLVEIHIGPVCAMTYRTNFPVFSEEFYELFNWLNDNHSGLTIFFTKFANAIDAAHGVVDDGTCELCGKEKLEHEQGKRCTGCMEYP